MNASWSEERGEASQGIRVGAPDASELKLMAREPRAVIFAYDHDLVGPGR